MEAVLFDFSATLFDPARVVDGAAFADHAARHGITLQHSAADALARQILALAETPVGKRDRVSCDLSTSDHRDGWIRLAARIPGVTAALAEAFHDCITDPQRWLPYADTAATLTALRRAGVRIGVVSNCGWDLRTAFAAAGLAELVDHYVLSCEHGRVKPDAELFLLATTALGVAPQAAVMVGDDPTADTGALAAGMAVYLLPAAEPHPVPRGLARVVRLVGIDDEAQP